MKNMPENFISSSDVKNERVKAEDARREVEVDSNKKFINPEITTEEKPVSSSERAEIKKEKEDAARRRAEVESNSKFQ